MLGAPRQIRWPKGQDGDEEALGDWHMGLVRKRPAGMATCARLSPVDGHVGAKLASWPLHHEQQLRAQQFGETE